jgi:hypothetical protein
VVDPPSSHLGIFWGLGGAAPQNVDRVLVRLRRLPLRLPAPTSQQRWHPPPTLLLPLLLGRPLLGL